MFVKCNEVSKIFEKFMEGKVFNRTRFLLASGNILKIMMICIFYVLRKKKK